MHQPKEIYDQIVAHGVPRIGRFVAESHSESLVLEFKEMPESRKDKLRVIAKAASGFANSEGGVIVWGVKCKRHSDGTADVATELKPFKDLSLVKELFDGELILQPGLTGMLNECIEESPGTGYLITFIPKWEGLPQMANASETRGFYCRVGNQTIQMEHYMIADRFQRRPQPKLSVSWKAERIGSRSADEWRFYLHFEISNVGRGIADHVMFAIKKTSGVTGINFNQRFAVRTGHVSQGSSQLITGEHRVLITVI